MYLRVFGIIGAMTVIRGFFLKSKNAIKKKKNCLKIRGYDNIM